MANTSAERKHEHLEEVVYKIRLVTLLVIIGSTGSLCFTIAMIGTKIEVRLSNLELKISNLESKLINHDAKFLEQYEEIKELKENERIIFNKFIRK